MLILLTNDDGYLAPGLSALRKVLGKTARLVTVAPDSDRSGASHSLTVNRPLRVKKVEKDFYTVNGTPTDAVMLAVYCLLKKKPDMVISGINAGANMGEDVTYSGTVAAAIEGAMLGIPSIAVSLAVVNRQEPHKQSDFMKAAKFTLKLIRAINRYGLPEGVLLNINVPAVKRMDIRKYTITSLGKRIYEDVVTEKIDPRGESYYWIAGRVKITGKGPQTDFGAIGRNYVSVTPLAVDITAKDFIKELTGWKL
ncbi:MAG: 5'/3'-nucleotidase SurE [Candidatus Zixiibacteriota bacterium]|nr:MAG: 5'/3'-nucleotidase SurE [candidate division Zixibacteria bacterium]